MKWLITYLISLFIKNGTLNLQAVLPLTIGLFIVCLLIALLLRHRERGEDAEKDFESVFRSPPEPSALDEPEAAGDVHFPTFVLLLREPRDPAIFDAGCIARVFENALGLDLKGEDGSDGSIAGSGLRFAGEIGGQLIMILNDLKPYIADPQAAAGHLREKRTAHAVRQHRACLSVSIAMPCPLADAAAGYRLIGKLAAALAGPLEMPAADRRGRPATLPAALAVCWPDPTTGDGHIRVYDSELHDRLSSDDPLSAFREVHTTNPPIIEAKDDDPRLVAATAEARRRWPEFLAAFARRQPDQTFAIKTAVKEGALLEYMWLTVDRIEAGALHSTLANEPNRLTRIQLGDRLKVRAADIVDWAFGNDGGMEGAFSVQALAEIAREGRAQGK